MICSASFDRNVEPACRQAAVELPASACLNARFECGAKRTSTVNIMNDSIE